MSCAQNAGENNEVNGNHCARSATGDGKEVSESLGLASSSGRDGTVFGSSADASLASSSSAAAPSSASSSASSATSAKISTTPLKLVMCGSKYADVTLLWGEEVGYRLDAMTIGAASGLCDRLIAEQDARGLPRAVDVSEMSTVFPSEGALSRWCTLVAANGDAERREALATINQTHWTQLAVTCHGLACAELSLFLRQVLLDALWELKGPTIHGDDAASIAARSGAVVTGAFLPVAGFKLPLVGSLEELSKGSGYVHLAQRKIARAEERLLTTAWITALVHFTQLSDREARSRVLALCVNWFQVPNEEIIASDALSLADWRALAIAYASRR